MNQEETINEEKSEFVKDMEGIFSDIKTSDVAVIVGSERFHCHKTFSVQGEWCSRTCLLPTPLNVN